MCVAPAAPPPLWAVPGPPGHEKRTPTDADAHDLKIVVKLRAVPASKVPFPVEIAGFPDFSRPVPVYPAFLKYVVPVHLPRGNGKIGICRKIIVGFYISINYTALQAENLIFESLGYGIAFLTTVRGLLLVLEAARLI